MSGGHFDYQQYKINEIADSIEREIRHNEIAILYLIDKQYR